MAAAKKCQAGHKGCDCKLLCCVLPPARGEEIKVDAQKTVNWASQRNYGPACECGLITSKGCPRHA